MYQRRKFLAGCCAAAVLPMKMVSGQTQSALQNEPVVLSSTASSRATAYTNSHKMTYSKGILTVSYLGNADGKFENIVQDINVYKNAVSAPHVLGPSQDNHGGVDILQDASGRQHVAYYPHSGPIWYQTRASISDPWSEVETIGDDYTYPLLSLDRDSSLVMLARQTRHRPGPDPFVTLDIFRRTVGAKSWSPARHLIQAHWRGYTHFLTSLQIDMAGTWHLFVMAHEHSIPDAYGQSHRLAYMKSNDQGDTWQSLLGEALTCRTAGRLRCAMRDSFDMADLDVIAEGGLSRDKLFYSGRATVTNEGVPMTALAVRERDKSELLLISGGAVGWDMAPLWQYLPQDVQHLHITGPGPSLGYDGRGTLWIVFSLQDTQHLEGSLHQINVSSWGHRSTEVCALSRAKGQNDFQFHRVSQPNPDVAQWLPTLGAFADSDSAYVMFTQGAPGRNNTQVQANKVLLAQLP